MGLLPNDNREVVLYKVSIWRLYFHSAKFDNFKDEKITDYKTVSVAQSKKLAGLKTVGLVGL